MEKICIVRRRKDARFVEPGPAFIPGQTAVPKQHPGASLAEAVRDGGMAREGTPSLVGERVGKKKEVISFHLTSEQCGVIRSGNFERYLSNGISKGAALSVQEQADGQISISFYFDRVNTLKLLKPKQVCEMLQISRSSLGTLIKTRKLKSYKIGGLRRFAVEDIIDFLARGAYLENHR